MDWHDPSIYKQHWATRAPRVIPLLASSRVVCDIGCGAPQTLRTLLPKTVKYLPADLKQWTPDTELCDLNAGLFPEAALAAADTCVILGVFEYLNEPEKVLSEIAKRCPRLVFSYHPLDLQDTWQDIWIGKPLKMYDLLDAISGASFTSKTIIDIDKRQFAFDCRSTCSPSSGGLSW